MPAVALVFVLFGFYMYALEKRDAEARNEELATYITGKANQALINWIQSQIDLAQTIAEDPRLVALCLHPTNAAVRAEAQSFLSAMMKRYPNNENIPVAIRLGKDDGF
ncbi:MAG: hypothetical protein EOM20_19640, partial [Spartobacteria bacterium]|nr:hypothetical protein [Spartobacteria bacterium]